MRVHLAIIFSLICGPAIADDTVTVTSTTANRTQVQLVPHTPIEQGRFCQQFYPAASHAEGKNTLAFTIEPDGSVKDIRVIKSSNDKNLDDAAIQCAQHWPYGPMKRNSVPMKTPSVIDFVWAPPDTALAQKTSPASGGSSYESGDTKFSANVPIDGHTTSVGRPHTCTQSYPAAAIAAHAEGTTTMSFTVTVEGNVANPTVAKSSGNKDLDDAALQCVTFWHYKPATEDGKPKAVQWQANVVWKMGEPPEVRRAELCLKYRKGLIQIPKGVGATIVSFRVMPDGTMEAAAVTRSSGDLSLDDAAIRCVAASHFDTSLITLPAEGIPGHADLDWARITIPPAPISPPAASPPSK